MPRNTRSRLIDAATEQVRQRGYHAVSFRELADTLEIKSASVHYHFPQKEDLGCAIVHAYSTAFFAALDEKVDGVSSFSLRLRAIRDLYRDALRQSEAHCLCGMLGAEARGLPPPVREAVNAFFEANVNWVSQALPGGTRNRVARARQVISTLQGAIMLAGSLDNPLVFDEATSRLLKDASSW